MNTAKQGFLVILAVLAFAAPVLAGLIQPEDLVYKGAFRLPDASGTSSWGYSGRGLTHYPSGDPAGPSDGYPGSLFGIGHDHHYHVSEIDIPVPIVASSVEELNTAKTLQPFSSVTAGLWPEDAYFEIFYADLQYLPAMGSQATGKLHFVWGQHYEDANLPTHFWTDTDLANPSPAGPWRFGDYTPYATDDYLFEIPASWANAYTPGMRLACGRFREGEWGGRGPALFAYGPWNEGNPPAANTTLQSITPLLLYGHSMGQTLAVESDDTTEMTGYTEADEWSGGAWLTAGNNWAVAIVGTKGLGASWYGFANGVTTWPPVPEWPWDQRGWWAESYQRRIIFYSPDQLGEVAAGRQTTWWPQPYASFNLDPYLFAVSSDTPRYNQEERLGAAAFDRQNGLLYIVERLADGEKSVVHVFAVTDSGQNAQEPPADTCLTVGSDLSLTFPCVTVGGASFGFTMTYAGGLSWEISGSTITAGAATGCISATADLDIAVACAQYAGMNVHFTLNHVSGLTWQLDPGTYGVNSP